jgi:hypothetical protein
MVAGLDVPKGASSVRKTDIQTIGLENYMPQ